jgi:hypothetical protein
MRAPGTPHWLSTVIDTGSISQAVRLLVLQFYIYRSKNLIDLISCSEAGKKHADELPNEYCIDYHGKRPTSHTIDEERISGLGTFAMRTFT